jgi:hypothetical protein
MIQRAGTSCRHVRGAVRGRCASAQRHATQVHGPHLAAHNNNSTRDTRKRDNSTRTHTVSGVLLCSSHRAGPLPPARHARALGSWSSHRIIRRAWRGPPSSTSTCCVLRARSGRGRPRWHRLCRGLCRQPRPHRRPQSRQSRRRRLPDSLTGPQRARSRQTCRWARPACSSRPCRRRCRGPRRSRRSCQPACVPWPRWPTCT